ncbi:MAG: class I SAM-dependent methyltransferase [Proteobacteria bacterium]|nr:class I SAM-dependent methyltransferase [Pseudomonadota bacterium]
MFNYYPRHKPKNETKILELGFGSGCNLWFCAKEGFNCYGIEGSSFAVNHAKEWFLRENLFPVYLQQSLFYPLDFQSNFFDLVIDRSSLTCVNTNECLASLKEVHRVLKPEGYFCFNPFSTKHTSYLEGDLLDSGLTQFKSDSFLKVDNLKFYNEEELYKLILAAGFKIYEMKHIEEKFYTPENIIHAEWFLILGK